MKKPPKHAKAKKLHVISPATAAQIRRTLKIGRKEIKNIRTVFKKAGVKYT